MAGIQLFQPNGAGILNAAGAQHPAPVTVEAGMICQLSFVGGTTAIYRWALSKPGSSSSVLSSATSAGPSFLPDIDNGAYSISLIDIDEVEYILDIVTPTTGGGGGGGGGGVVTTANTYDDLRNQVAFSGTPPSALVLQCRSTVDDGGGGIFAYDSSDTTTADNDGTVLVDISGHRFKRIFAGAVDPRWFGVVFDNATDDAAAWAATVALFGATSRTRAGAIHVPNATSAIDSTIALSRFSGLFSGEGAGTSLGGTCAIRWSGSTSDPLIRLRRCWGTHIADIRLIGNSANPPSAAIDLHTVTADGSPHNTDISIENVWIGGISGEDTVITEGFENGITFSGDPVQNDQSLIKKCVFQDIRDVGIDIATAQATILEIDACKFNAVPVGIQTISRGLLVRSCFFSTIDDANVKLVGDSGVHISNCGAEGCARLLYGVSGTGAGITISGEYFQVNQRTIDVGGAFIEVGGGQIQLVIEDLNVTSDGAMGSGEAKISVTNCTHLTLICRNVNFYDGLPVIDHLDIATTGAGQSRLVIWDFEGVTYVNYWEHGAHANAQLGYRHDFPAGATLPPDTAITTVDVAGLTRSLLKFNSTGDFASYLELSDAVTPIAIAGDLAARQANIDIREFRNLLSLLGYISWDASTMGGVKITPNEGTPNGVVTAEPGSVCLDYDTPGLHFKVTGSGNTGWQAVHTLNVGAISRVARATPWFSNAAEWAINDDGHAIAQVNTDSFAYWVLDVPHGSLITTVTAFLSGTGHGALPASMPVLTVHEHTISTNGTSTAGTATDGSGSTGVYDAAHVIDAAVSITVDNVDHRYVAILRNEHGANAQVGLDVYMIMVSFTPAAPDRGAA